MGRTLADIASELGAILHGPGDVPVRGIASLSSAGPDQLSFLANSALRDRLAGCGAAAVLCRRDDVEECPVPALEVEDPYAAFARISHYFDPAPTPAPGVHPAAVVDPSVSVPDSVSVGPAAVIEAGVELGDSVVVMAGSVVGAGSRLGEGVTLHPNVTIYHGVALGPRTIIHAASVLGSDGFGYAPTRDGWLKVAQAGGLRIGADVEIGAGCTIDRGALEDTVIEDGVILDNQVHVGHNVFIGAHTAIAAKVGIAGSARIGRRCMFAGMAGVNSHIEICDDVQVLGMGMISASIHEPGAYGSALPAQERRLYQRNVARYRKLGELFRRVRKLESGAD